MSGKKTRAVKRVLKRVQKRPPVITLDQLEGELKDEKKFFSNLMEYGILKKPVCSCGEKDIKLVTYRDRLWFRCCSRKCRKRTACTPSALVVRQRLPLKQWIKVFFRVTVRVRVRVRVRCCLSGGLPLERGHQVRRHPQDHGAHATDSLQASH